MARDPRKGVGGSAYQRRAKSLKHRVKQFGLVCAWCGGPIDTNLPSNHRLAFTADHPEALAAGGALVDQELAPMHRACNASKGGRAKVAVKLRPAG